VDDVLSEARVTLDKDAYVMRTVNRMQPGWYTTQTRHACEAYAQRCRLNRAWREQGSNRPLLCQFGEGKGAKVWVLERAQAAAMLFDRSQSYRSAGLYQVNQATGQWTHTRYRTLHETALDLILPLSDKRVQKARTWAVRRKLNGET